MANPFMPDHTGPSLPALNSVGNRPALSSPGTAPVAITDPTQSGLNGAPNGGGPPSPPTQSYSGPGAIISLPWPALRPTAGPPTIGAPQSALHRHLRPHRYPRLCPHRRLARYYQILLRLVPRRLRRQHRRQHLLRSLRRRLTLHQRPRAAQGGVVMSAARPAAQPAVRPAAQVAAALGARAAVGRIPG